MRLVGLIAGLVAAATLAGCSSLARVKVVNRSGHAISFQVWDADRGESVVISVAAGTSRTVFVGRMRERPFPITVAGCRYAYDLPLETLAGLANSPPILVEVTAGLDLRLAHPKLPSALTASPLPPASKTCG